MARYPGTLESANTNEFGIVFADHIQGHKTVANLNALYNISDAILSKSKTNAGNDAIGQEWYVVSEGYYYRLDNWANRRQASGWRKLQNTDEEFDSLQNHGVDKIKNFTTTNSTVSLNFNTWKNSTTSTDGSVTIPAATGDQAGVLTANGKDQLTQLNKIGELTHLTDSGVFTEEASTVTIHYNCINTKEGATSSVVTKSEAIPEATLTNAGVLSAAKRNQLEQLDKLGEVTHLTDGGVFTTNANVATIHYQCIDTNSGANSAVSTKTANIPAATLTNAGVLDAAHRNQLEQLDKLGEVTHLTDNGVFTTDANTVTLHYQCIDTDAGANSAVSTKTAVIPEATLTNAGTLASSNRNQLEQLNKIEKTSFLHHTSDNSSATFTSTGSAVTLHWDTIDTTDGANSEVTERSANIPVASSTSAGTMSSTDKIEHDRISTVNFALGSVTPSTTTVQIAASKTNITNGSSVNNNITIPGVTETAAGVMSSADKAKLNDITIPEGGVNFSGEETDIINGAGDSVDLMAKFPATVVTNLTGVTPSTSSATINFSRSAKDTLDYNAATSNTITIPAATTSAAGLMSSTDKTEHDRISTVNFALGAVTPNTTAITIAASKTNITNGSSVANNITIPGVTETTAGVMSSADKAKLNDITIPSGGVSFSGDATDVINGAGDSVDLMAKFPATVVTNITGVTPAASTVAVNFSRSAKDTLDYNAATGTSITLPAVTESVAGVMIASDKAKLNDIQFVQSLTTTGTQTVSVTSDTVVINSTSQLNVIGIKANAYNKVRFVNATSINVLFTFNNSGAGNNKLLTTYYPSQITIPQYCSVEFVKSSTGWILSDLTGVTYFPDVDTDETKIVTVNSDRSIGTLPIRVMKEWDETVTEELSVSKLNQRFPDAPVGFQLVCVSINRIYEKFNETNEWVCHFIWENETSGTATTSEKGLMSAADKLKLDNTIPNYTVNGLKISTNPVLDGADVKITGYSQPSSSSALTSSDTINAALGKLEKGLNNEISNRTTAVNNLRSEINNNINTKLDELEQQINENIDTRLTEVENEINNTITPKINSINTTISNLDIFSDFKTDSGTASATTNNDSITISGGTNISTSGSGKTVTINLDSTISLTRVNASSGFYQQSDERLKSNIKPLEHTLEDICSIPTDSFILNGKQDLGTIAQDVEKIIPEVVCECEVKAAEIPNPENFTKVEKDGETYVLVKEVDYAKLSILALEGIKLLKAEVDKLKEELALRENK